VIGDNEFETDIVILNPSYPTRLRAHEEILAGGVAAAFSVKLTLDAAGIRDGVKRLFELSRDAVTVRLRKVVGSLLLTVPGAWSGGSA
jgi:hypothetical protein